MAKNGLKICSDTAGVIRERVQGQIKQLGRVDKREMADMHDEALVDDYFHQRTDPKFWYGGGPAVKREGER